jgi:hypothetical protein
MRVSSSSGSKADVRESCETVMIMAETDAEKTELAAFVNMVREYGVETVRECAGGRYSVYACEPLEEPL